MGLDALRRKVSEFDSHHNVIYQVGDRRRYYLLETGLCLQHPKAGIGQTALYRRHPMTGIGTYLELGGDETGHLIQDGATDASIATLEQQEQQDILDILGDRYLPGLLFHKEELRPLIRKHSQAIQCYYV